MQSETSQRSKDSIIENREATTDFNLNDLVKSLRNETTHTLPKTQITQAGNQYLNFLLSLQEALPLNDYPLFLLLTDLQFRYLHYILSLTFPVCRIEGISPQKHLVWRSSKNKITISDLATQEEYTQFETVKLQNLDSGGISSRSLYIA